MFNSINLLIAIVKAKLTVANDGLVSGHCSLIFSIIRQAKNTTRMAMLMELAIITSTQTYAISERNKDITSKLPVSYINKPTGQKCSSLI